DQGLKPCKDPKKQAPSVANGSAGSAISSWEHLMFISGNGGPSGLQNVRDGWQQAEIEQPLYAEVAGLALGMRAMESGTLKDLNGKECTILGVTGLIAEEAEDGLVMKFRGNKLTKDNIDKEKDRLFLWGDLRRPSFGPSDLQSIHCT